MGRRRDRTLATVAVFALTVASWCQQMPASFQTKSTVFTDAFDVGPEGAFFRAPVRGVPTDGVTVDILPKSIGKAIRVSIGYSTGSLRLKSGTPSGTVLVLKSNPETIFGREVKIGVSFLPNRKYRTLVGYEIDSQGRLRPLDLMDLDVNGGRVSFFTFKCLTFTWIYVE